MVPVLRGDERGRRLLPAARPGAGDGSGFCRGSGHGLVGDAPLDVLVAAVWPESVVTFPVWKRARFVEAARAVWGMLRAFRAGVACG